MDAAAVKALALEEGFDDCRIADAAAGWEAGARLLRFVGEGRHGSMSWMADTATRRSHPRAMWPEAASAVTVALSYAPPRDPLRDLAHPSHGNISVYARGSDYHDLVKKRLKRLARAVHAATGEAVKVFVDTAPLMEKPLAMRAGLGWQGKHTNLLSQRLGNWFFIGVVLTAARLEPDAPGRDACGTCRACQDICPTDAFPAPYQLDARRCISYLTIEHKGPIPREFRTAMGNRIYGCDDCLAVCPWNKFAVAGREARLRARAETTLPELRALAALDDAAFREVFAGSPVKRTGRDRFVRNVCIAIGNSADSSLVSALSPLLEDDSPLVRGAAVWALARLDRHAFRAAAAERLATEADPEVREEWAAAEAGLNGTAQGAG